MFFIDDIIKIDKEPYLDHIWEGNTSRTEIAPILAFYNLIIREKTKNYKFCVEIRKVSTGVLV
ncbi:MAG: hypothetical protein ABUK01_18100, partial [Leptospirales bacterium]